MFLVFKGVCWDPIGSYLASQSDDRTVKIWKTLDWKLEKTITSPFEKVSNFEISYIKNKNMSCFLVKFLSFKNRSLSENLNIGFCT